jgi:hypothetical protein
MNVRRRSGDMDHPIGSAIKNAVNQRKDMKTTPKDIPHSVSQARDACYDTVRGAVNQRKGA